MSVTVNWNNLIAGGDAVGQAVFKNLQTFVQRLNPWMAKEHDPNTGVHTEVTATSLAVAGIATMQRLRIDPTMITVFPLTANGVIVVDKPYMVIKVTSDAVATRIDGLYNPLYQVGDIVLLCNATDENPVSGVNLTVRLEALGADKPNTRFVGNPTVTNDDYTLKPGRMLVCLRDRDSLASSSDPMYWRTCVL